MALKNLLGLVMTNVLASPMFVAFNAYFKWFISW